MQLEHTLFLKGLSGVDPCYICIEELSLDGKPTQASPCICKAQVHYGCMQKWLQSSNTNVCPNCRSDLKHMFGVEYRMEETKENVVQDLNSEIVIIERFFYISRILCTLACVSLATIVCMAFVTKELGMGMVIFVVLMIGPLVLLWLLLLFYIIAIKIKKMSQRTDRVLPNEAV